MFGYWKEKYQQLYRESRHTMDIVNRILEGQEQRIAILKRRLAVCKARCPGVVIADTLSLTLQFCGGTFSNIVIKNNNTMAVTLPVGKFVIATITGVEKATGKQGPITEIELASTDPSVLLVEPVFDTDGTTSIPSQRKVTTLKEGAATLSFSAKNSLGALISGTEDWTVDNGTVPVVVDSLTISYGEPQDVPPTT